MSKNHPESTAPENPKAEILFDAGAHKIQESPKRRKPRHSERYDNADLLQRLLGHSDFAHFKKNGADDWRDTSQKNPPLSLSSKGLYDHKSSTSTSLFNACKERDLLNDPAPRAKTKSSPKPKPAADDKPDNSETAKKIWEDSAANSAQAPAEKYFTAHRKIPLSNYRDLLNSIIRFVPRSEHPTRPAMLLTRVHQPKSTRVAIHRIELRDDGSKLNKKMLGGSGITQVPPLSGEKPDHVRVCEGLEDCLSLREMFPSAMFLVSNNKGNLKLVPPFLESKELPITILSDHDANENPSENGQTDAAKLRTALSADGFDVVARMPVTAGDDANQALQEDRLSEWLQSLEDVPEIETAASNTDSPDSDSGTDFYQFSEFGITRKKETKDGPVYVPLSNFVSRITEEQLHDDGETSALIFQVETTCLGQKMPTVTVPASEFASLRFVAEHFGNRAQIFPSATTRDYLRHAIQVHSGLNVPRRHIFTHTGLTEIDGKLTYLSSTGALDAPTVSVELDTTSQPNLSRYQLPMESTPEETHAGIRASLDFLDVAERSVSTPLWVASYGAAIISEIEDHFASLLLLGPTGCRKTTLGTLALNHHGNFTDENLFSFGATSNFLERAAFTLKDAPMLVDDFYPTTNKRDQDKMVSVFEHLTRNAGNRSGRGRMNADLSLRRTFYPRGMVWFTGEDLIAASSAIARLTLVPVEPDSVDLARLTDLQSRKQMLPHALADFLRWWRDNRSRARAIFADKTLESQLHARYGNTLHGRIPRQLALWQHSLPKTHDLRTSFWAGGARTLSLRRARPFGT